MKVSKRSEYAVRALVELNRSSRQGKPWIQIAHIAERSGVPEKFLEQILLTLKKAQYLKSRRGVDGGYTLDCDPQRLTIEQIIEVMDGGTAFEINTTNPTSSGAALREVLERSETAWREVLGSVTLGAFTDEVISMDDDTPDFQI